MKGWPMERPDPYRPPRANLSQRPVAAASAAITRNMIDSLVKTRPWVLLFGILMMIGCGFLILGGIAMFALGGMAGLGGEGFGPMAGAGIGAAYLVLAALYFFPALYLIRYAGAIKRIGPANPAAMEEALAQQASFWRFVGILTVVVTLIYIVAIAVFAVIAAMGAASAG
jgi:hypothetical protein